MLDIDVSIASDGWRSDLPEAESLARQAAEAVMRRAGPATDARLELSVLFADDDTVRDLNRGYRGKDAPTNVLSFPGEMPETLNASAVAAGRPLPLGDVVLAHGTVTREAAEQDKPLHDHAGHLLVHGFLHLLGYDHQSDGDAAIMEALETAILAGLGIADPYRADRCPPATDTEAET